MWFAWYDKTSWRSLPVPSGNKHIRLPVSRSLGEGVNPVVEATDHNDMVVTMIQSNPQGG